MEFHAIILSKEPEDPDLQKVQEHERVFKDKLDALKNMKKWKSCQPRLQIFDCEEKALESARKLCPQPQPPQIVENPSNPPSEACPFKSLTPQELKQIKEAIGNDDEETIRKLVAQNPRYLMTTCDQPAIIHSGTRANPLHIAAQQGKLKMAELILELVTDSSLIERMYPLDSQESIAKRQEYLLDLYLNMPKKGDFDTPLHQASKFGHWPVVQLLVEFSSCNTKCVNREGKTPAQVVCSRSDPDQDVKRKILDLLADKVYIPVYRADDYSVPGSIGEPISSSNDIEFMPSVSSSPNNRLKAHHPNLSPWLSPMSPKGRLAHGDSPALVLMKSAKMSPITSPLSVRAVLGPLSPGDAEKVKSEWKKQSPANKLIRIMDPEKGLERQGRELAAKYNTSLVEYWPFLNAYVNLTSDEGLQMLEDHLNGLEKAANSINDKGDLLADIESGFADLNLNSGSDPGGQNKSFNESNDINSYKELGVMSALDNFRDMPSAKQSNYTFPPIATNTLPQDVIWNQPRQRNDVFSMSSDENFNSSTQLSMSPSSSSGSFISAVSSLDESIYSAEEGSWLYINGSQPSKMDEQVFQALQICDNIDAKKYPAVHTWMCLIEASDPQERKKWPHATPKGRKPIPVPKLVFDDHDQ